MSENEDTLRASGPIQCLVVCEGEALADPVNFETHTEMRLYWLGFVDGAGQYGCGSVRLYVVEPASLDAPDIPPAVEMRIRRMLANSQE